MNRRSFLRRTFGTALALAAGFYGWEPESPFEARKKRAGEWFVEQFNAKSTDHGGWLVPPEFAATIEKLRNGEIQRIDGPKRSALTATWINA